MDASSTTDTDKAPSPSVRIGAVAERTEAEGPGVRFAVWAQGCTIRCSGCFNPHLWGTHDGRHTPAQELAQHATAAATNDREIEGVTLLGGEPFEQAQAFAAFATAVGAAGLSVMVFTGYSREHLEGPDAPPGSAALLAATDLLVDGPYRAEQKDLLRPWVGSTNQRFHFLTSRYEHLTEKLTTLPDRVEIRIARSGDITVNGWATVDQLDTLLADTAPKTGRGNVR